MKIDEVILSEYGDYFLSDGKVFKYYRDQLTQIPIPERIISGSAGVHHACMIGESGQVYNCIWPDLTFSKPAITDGVTSASFWTTYAVATKSGLSAFNNISETVKLKLPTPSTRFVKLAAAHVLLALDTEGNVWQYDWSGAAVRGTATLDLIEDLVPKKVVLPGAATDITASRVMYQVAIVNGDPYAWCANFGAQYIGLPGATATPVNMKDKWGLTTKIKTIAAGDNSLHMIDEAGKLWGIGDNEIGEVGTGEVGANFKTTGQWNMEKRTFITKAVDVSRGRKFDTISKGNSYVYRTFAKETNGTWNSWGSDKGGLLANGIFPPDEGQAGNHEQVMPWRVAIPQTLKRVDQAFLKSTAYPPKEIEPNPEPVTRTLFVTAHFYTDKTVSLAKSINKKKTLLADVKVFTDGSIEKV